MPKQKWLIARRFTTKDGDYAHRTQRRPGIDPANRPGA
jgi:hypothetical protein